MQALLSIISTIFKNFQSNEMSNSRKPVVEKIDHSTNYALNLQSDSFRAKVINMPPHVATSFRVKTVAQHTAGSMQKYGWSVVDHFLGSFRAERVFVEVSKLYEDGCFVDGQLVKIIDEGFAASLSSTIRSDKILWFGNSNTEQLNVSFLLSVIDSVVFCCSPLMAPYRLTGRSRAMIACYPGNGSHYVTHVDNPDCDGRCITAIYYLNQTQVGGELRLYPENAINFIDIEPKFDRLIFFWSDKRIPHEVLPVYSDRFAITVWYFDAKQKADAEKNDGSVSCKAKFSVEKILQSDSALPLPPPDDA